METKIRDLIDRLAICQAKCNYCLNACLHEEDVKMMTKCIKLDKDCAEICSLTLSLFASDSDFKNDIVKLCIDACEKCGEECGKHDYEHCQHCAEACRKCAAALKAL